MRRLQRLYSFPRRELSAEKNSVKSSPSFSYWLRMRLLILSSVSVEDVTSLMATLNSLCLFSNVKIYSCWTDIVAVSWEICCVWVAVS